MLDAPLDRRGLGLRVALALLGPGRRCLGAHGGDQGARGAEVPVLARGELLVGGDAAQASQEVRLQVLRRQLGQRLLELGLGKLVQAPLLLLLLLLLLVGTIRSSTIRSSAIPRLAALDDSPEGFLQRVDAGLLARANRRLDLGRVLLGGLGHGRLDLLDQRRLVLVEGLPGLGVDRLRIDRGASGGNSGVDHGRDQGCQPRLECRPQLDQSIA